MMIPIQEIQKALKAEKLDGWLFCDFRGSNVIACRILQIGDRMATRRWYYFIPISGEPTRIVHAIESGNLDHVPGKKIVFSSWQDLHRALKDILKDSKKIAMEYSPENDVPYISKTDAGTIELVRKQGVEVISSGDLVQVFEARWNPDQVKSHFEAAKRVNQVKDQGFQFIGDSLRAGKSITEYDVQQYMWTLFSKNNLTADHAAIVAVNANTSNPHYGPQKDHSAPIRDGDLVLIDIWGKLKEPESIYGDITWIGYVGKDVPQKFADVFRIVRDARMSAFDLIESNFKQGKTTFGWQADQAARSYIEDHKYGKYYIHRTGHNIGQEVHGYGANLDNLETRDSRKLIQETGFSIEPGIYLPEFGIRSEIDVYIGKDGPVITSPEQTEIIPLLA
jgi:Xaa-Pro aminopeptidase